MPPIIALWPRMSWPDRMLRCSLQSLRAESEALHGAQGLRDVGDSIVLMGKNTMMKRSIRLYCERTGNESWSNLVDSLVGNVGLIFTKADLAEVTAQCCAHTARHQRCNAHPVCICVMALLCCTARAG